MKRVVISSLALGLLFCPLALMHSVHAQSISGRQSAVSFNKAHTAIHHIKQLRPQQSVSVKPIHANSTVRTAVVPRKHVYVRHYHSMRRHYYPRYSHRIYNRYTRRRFAKKSNRRLVIHKRRQISRKFIPRKITRRHSIRHVYKPRIHQHYRPRIKILNNHYMHHVARHHVTFSDTIARYPKRNSLINPNPRWYKAIGDSTKPHYNLPYMHRLSNLPMDNVQSLTVTPNGHWAYLCNGSDHNTGYGYLVKYDLLHNRIAKIGSWHFFGHGQSMTYYRNQLLFLAKTYNNDGAYAGPMNRGEFIFVSPKTLNPTSYQRIYFRTYPDRVGDVLAYDGHSLYDDNRLVNSPRPAFRSTSIDFYKVDLHNNRASFYRYNRGLAHSAGYYVQSMAYDPANKRMYVETSRPDRLLSFPLTKLQSDRLRARDVHVTNMHQTRETEGIAFDRAGHSYYILGRPYHATLYKIWKQLM